LGLQFLRHIERTRLLVFLIPIDSEEWQSEFNRLRLEIASYSADLAEKPYCVVFSKLDLLGEDYVPEIDAPGSIGSFCISAVAQKGLDSLKETLWLALAGIRTEEERVSAANAGS
jgi:GTP-binding protein